MQETLIRMRLWVNLFSHIDFHSCFRMLTLYATNELYIIHPQLLISVLRWLHKLNVEFAADSNVCMHLVLSITERIWLPCWFRAFIYLQ
jgi:hypothetical protein